MYTLGKILLLATLLAVWMPVRAQSPEPVAVLIVTAHPDDEAMFAGAVYKLTHDLGAKVDLALVTDGSGGYRFATLAEPLYGLKLTEEAVARQYLPAIRKQELMAGGRIIGLRKYFFLDQPDLAYTVSADTVLTQQWDTTFVRNRLRHIMQQGDYDYAFVHLPPEQMHGAHKAATILALETARSLDAARRPVVLGGWIVGKDDSTFAFSGLPGYPVTKVQEGTPPFAFDLEQPLGPEGRLNYQIVVNWLIAEHKSQGTMQLLVNRGDLEQFWFFAVNDPAALPATRALFERLRQPNGD